MPSTMWCSCGVAPAELAEYQPRLEQLQHSGTLQLIDRLDVPGSDPTGPRRRWRARWGSGESAVLAALIAQRWPWRRDYSSWAVRADGMRPWERGAGLVEPETRRARCC